MRLREFAPAGGGGSGNYFQALASAWYNGVFDTGSLPRGIKTQEDVERLLNRGIVCPDGKTRKLHIDYNSDFDGVEIYSDDYYEYGDHDDTIDSRTGEKWGPYDYMEFSDEQLDEATGDEKFDTMMGQIQREPKYPDSQMPPTDVKDLYQWAIKNNKPYHKIFAEWANREGYKSVAPALQRAGDLDTEALDYWTPRVWKIYWGEVRGIDSEMPPEWAKKRVPDELRDYLETVFDAYDRIVFDWPTEYRQIGGQGNYAEGLPQTLRKVVPGYAKREIDKKMDDQKFGKTDVDRDANYYRYKKIQDKIKEQGVAEGAPISGNGGAVDNFKQQMANNTEIAYQKGMAEAKKKKKKKSSRSLGRYFFPGYGYYGSGESGEGGGDGGGGESINRGVAEGDLNEKSTSQAQFRTMAAAAHDPEFARKVGIKPSVAREFNQADKGQSYKSLPKKAD